jgi:hypothetical protein
MRLQRRNAVGVLVGLCVMGATGWAGSFSQDARGTSAGVFLKLPVSARSSGLGGAVTALLGEAASLAWNPAGLSHVKGKKALLSYSPYLDETAYSNAIYAQDVESGGVAVGLTYFDAGSIDQTEETAGNVMGSYHPSSWAGTVGYGHRWGGWSLGGGAKYVTTRVVESDGTMALDLGALSPQFWSERVRFGAVAKNVGGRLTLGEMSRPLPLEYRLGVAARPFPLWLVTGDLSFPRDDDPSAAIGTEGQWAPLAEWTFAARAGWSGAVDSSLGGWAGTTIGLGATYTNMTVDYSFSPVDDLGNSHQLSLGLAF